MGKRKRRQRYNGPDLTEHIDLKPGDNVQITLGAINDAGDTVAEIDGAPVIVAGGLPGEVVIAEVQKKFPERIAAIVSKVLEPADERIEPECKYFLTCSGCQWQHVSYDHQLQLKRERVQREILNYENLSGIEVDLTVKSEKRLKYRNHGRFTIGKYEDSGEVGYKNAVTRQFVRIEECLLMDEKVNDTIALVQDKMEGQTQISIRVGVNTGAMLVQPRMEIPGLDLVTGLQHYEEEVRGSRFTVAASSFFQVNTGQLSRVVDEVRQLLELGGEEVMVDAYCGVGVFAVLMSPYVKRVIGIEESPSAIEDANRNLNGATNIEFIQGKTEKVMADWQDEDSVDVLLLDPPRVGCHPDVLESVKKLQPKKVLMISCEPAAMARDLNLMCEGGMYKLDTVRPVDMFPQTRHVETISMLSFQGTKD